MDFFQWVKSKDLFLSWISNELDYPVFFTDDKLRLIFYNKSFESFFNLRNQKVTNRLLFEILPQLNEKAIYYSKALKGEKIVLDEDFEEIKITPVSSEGRVIGTVTEILNKTEDIIFQNIFSLIKSFNKKDTKELEKEIFKSILKTFKAKFGCVALIDNGNLNIRHCSEPIEVELRKEDDRYPFYHVINKEKILYYPDMRKTNVRSVTLKTLSAIAIPLKKSNSLFGVLLLEFKERDPLDDKLISYLEGFSSYLSGIIFENILWENYKELEDRYRLLAEQSLIGVFISQEDKMVYVNPQLVEILGYPFQLDSIMDFLKIISEEDKGKFLHRIRVLKERKLDYIIDEFKGIRKIDGKEVYFELCAVNTLYKGKPAILGTILDITYRKQLEEELKKISNTDSLTGLYNRRGFITLAEHTMSLAKRLRKNLILIFIDLDNMKWINDNLGHNVGDLALKETADILKKTFRENDLIARIGGDEFVVLGVVEKEEDKNEVLNRLRAKVEASNERKDRNFKLSLSIGTVFHTPDSNYSIEELLEIADKLMYEEKKKKKQAGINNF
ncbi:diguanylate cyclase [Dictyoglomus thermophilum]|uniref:diguanylate cyclase n=1 Tax=Dictyoglomus thermophilum (strain ATCC 35947 / DSM 3960 / H-6-12) TaxID=309799 RepID=B5YAP8_DICT6|nr:diguanylate cyclase [Dictyoglomus thermophilum]ACI19792.1 sensory box/ggdef domain protein [Dictyoglomus thermophilum H-6-12]